MRNDVRHDRTPAMPALSSRASVSRAAAGLMLSTAMLFGSALGAMAQQADDAASGAGSQAEWAQRYDSDARQQVQRETTPTLSPQTLFYN